MSVTKFCQAGPPEGQSKTSAVNSYRIPVTVFCDDADDDAGLVIDYLKNTAGYLIGSSYSQPNWVDAFSVVKRIEARKRAQSANPWVFDCHIIYDPATPNVEIEDPDGNLSENPLEWRLDIDSAFVQETLPVWTAYNGDAYPKDPSKAWAVKRDPNTLGPVINSAGTILDPPLMRNKSIRTLRISGNLSQYNENWLDWYIDKINGTSMYYSQLLKDKYGFEASTEHLIYEVWCVSAMASYQRANNIGFYRYTYEFRFKKRDPNFYPAVLTPYGPSAEGDGWLEHVLDLGIAIRKAPGTPIYDGTVVPGSAGSTPPEGSTDTGAALDLDGKRVPEKVLLDGNGLPARHSGSLAPTGTWFRYRKHEQVDMTGHPLNIFQATAPT